MSSSSPPSLSSLSTALSSASFSPNPFNTSSLPLRTFSLRAVFREDLTGWVSHDFCSSFPFLAGVPAPSFFAGVVLTRFDFFAIAVCFQEAAEYKIQAHCENVSGQRVANKDRLLEAAAAVA
ncbi:unnamed protein product [Chondrus crispus]|uniref:Uncharacterized protein n=1 Tax=Chondrus crispus TaxID=2769 RepID=R7QD85_CHOCR|nr:unnamed protein product [Chondrus crispus]CDF35406.1 unnamed protein product [Chondrus crispus]|eukprot:XP_005715225.1 unnamed protein product [Chondrus crispus]